MNSTQGILRAVTIGDIFVGLPTRLWE